MTGNDALKTHATNRPNQGGERAGGATKRAVVYTRRPAGTVLTFDGARAEAGRGGYEIGKLRPGFHFGFADLRVLAPSISMDFF